MREGRSSELKQGLAIATVSPPYRVHGIASQSHDWVSHPVTQPSFLSGTGGSGRNKAQLLLSRSLQSSGTALHRDSWGGTGPFSCYALTGVPAALPSGAVGWPA